MAVDNLQIKRGLDPCPFCAASEGDVESCGDGSQFRLIDIFQPEGKDEYIGLCEGCSSFGPPSMKDEKEAVTFWNSRFLEPDTSQTGIDLRDHDEEAIVVPPKGLVHCPFCGTTEQFINESPLGDGFYRVVGVLKVMSPETIEQLKKETSFREPTDEEIEYYNIICENCGADGPLAETEEDAITLWNHRADRVDKKQEYQ